jgi:cell division protein FtsB
MRSLAGTIRNWFLIALALLTISWMGWDIFFSDHGYRVYRSEQDSLETMKAEIEQLKSDRERLAREILRLRNDPKALEELIHSELGYVYPDEFMLIMPEGVSGDEKRGGGRP